MSKRVHQRSLLDFFELTTIKSRVKTCRKGHQYDAKEKRCPECRRLSVQKSQERVRQRTGTKTCAKGHEYDASKRQCPWCQKDWTKANIDKSHESNRKWREVNLEKARESDRKWRKANPEKVREKDRKKREANPEKARERKRKWAKANPDKISAKDSRKRAMHENAFQLESVDARIIEIHKPQPCVTCGQHCEKPTTGHILPEKRFGLHVPSVLHAQCRHCQGVQGSRDHPEPLRSKVIEDVKAELQSPEVAPEFVRWAMDGGLEKFQELSTLGLFKENFEKAS